MGACRVRERCIVSGMILLRHSILGLLTLALSACAHASKRAGHRLVTSEGVPEQRLVISVADQAMVTFERDVPKRLYRVSTSKFGTGDKAGSYKTPLGRMMVTEIVGQGLVAGTRLRSRQPTGEIIPPDTPGRDPIVTRVVRLQGMERRNARTLERSIYIHGTPEESRIGTPVSYGCVRMTSADIIRLCLWLKVGARVDILSGRVPAPEQLPR